ncbi:MAG: hypothetical protein V3U57_03965 [Robiginitomaculum sp.]
MGFKKYGLVILAILGTSMSAQANDTAQKYTIENRVKVYRGAGPKAERASQQQLQFALKTQLSFERLETQKAIALAKIKENNQAAFERGFTEGRKLATIQTRQPVRRYRLQYYLPYRYISSYRFNAHYGNRENHVWYHNHVRRHNPAIARKTHPSLIYE